MTETQAPYAVQREMRPELQQAPRRIILQNTVYAVMPDESYGSGGESYPRELVRHPLPMIDVDVAAGHCTVPDGHIRVSAGDYDVIELSPRDANQLAIALLEAAGGRYTPATPQPNSDGHVATDTILQVLADLGFKRPDMQLAVLLEKRYPGVDWASLSVKAALAAQRETAAKRAAQDARR